MYAERPSGKKGYDWCGILLMPIIKKRGSRKHTISNIFCATQLWLNRSRYWYGTSLRPEKPDKRPSYCMINAGFWGKEKGQLHRFFPWIQVTIPMNRLLDLKVGDCTCTETKMTGYVKVTEKEVRNYPEWMTDHGEMSWDISIEKQVAYHVGYGASKLFRSLNAFEMFWHAEGMKTAFSG